MGNQGFRIYTKVRRPDRKLVEKFNGIPVANIADNMGRLSCMDSGIVTLNNVKMVGTAITVKAPMGDNLMFHKAMDLAEPGDIIVVDGEGCMNHSLCGEIMMRYAIRRGIIGFVVDGCVRDMDAIKEINFGVYARGVQPKGPFKNGPGEINVPISVGGQVVHPGDIMCCDLDGIVVIRQEDAEELYEKAMAQIKSEHDKLEKISKDNLKKPWIDKELSEGGCEIVDDYSC